jgi:hypothetical protein
MMTSPRLAPLTPREQAVADIFRKPRVADSCMVFAAAVLGLLGRGLVQAYCGDSSGGSPFGPQDGTAGAHLCAKVSPGSTWVAYTLSAVAIACAVRWALRRKTYSRRMGLTVVSILLIAGTAWVYSLPSVSSP